MLFITVNEIHSFIKLDAMRMTVFVQDKKIK